MVDTRLVTFLTLLEEKSYTKTANKLYITQPAVTHHIKSLEKENGITLFKNNKTFELTDAGVLLKEYAQISNQHYSQFKNALLRQENKVSANVAMTTMVSDLINKKNISSTLMVDPIGVNFYEYSYQTIIKSLLDGSVDFAMVDNSFDSFMFDSFPLFSFNLILVCSTSGQYKDKDRITRDQLASATLIMGEEESGIYRCTVNALQQKNIRFHHNKVFHFNTVEWMMQETISFDGIAFIYEELARPFIEQGLIKRIELLNFHSTQNVYILYNRTSFLDNQILNFIEQIKKIKLV